MRMTEGKIQNLLSSAFYPNPPLIYRFKCLRIAASKKGNYLTKFNKYCKK